eukprot:EG_transcript_12065
MAWAKLRIALLGVALVSATQDTQWHGCFVVKRQSSSCVQLTVSVLEATKAVLPNCLVYQFGELWHAAAYGVSYTKQADPRKYWMRVASLTVRGHLDGHNLSFHCPTKAHFGTPPTRCNATRNRQLAVLHVGADHRLYEMDIVRAPAHLPAGSMLPGQAGFGAASIGFPSGIPLQESGFLRLCKLTSDFPPPRCRYPVNPPRAAQVPMPSHVGMGTFLRAPGTPVVASDWILDAANQLSVVAVGSARYFFNSAGVHVSKDGACSVSSAQDYAAHLQVRGSTFFDYSTTMTVITHPSNNAFAPTWVDVWVGVVFDVDQIKGAVLYTEVITGYHRGMDMFDVASHEGIYRGSYWYSSVAPVLPGLTVWAYADRMTTLGDPCAAQLRNWLYPQHQRTTCPDDLVLNDGLCEASPVASGRHDIGMTSDMVLQLAGYSSHRILSGIVGAALAMVLGLRLAGMMWTVR